MAKPESQRLVEEISSILLDYANEEGLLNLHEKALVLSNEFHTISGYEEKPYTYSIMGLGQLSLETIEREHTTIDGGLSWNTTLRSADRSEMIQISLERRMYGELNMHLRASTKSKTLIVEAELVQGSEGSIFQGFVTTHGKMPGTVEGLQGFLNSMKTFIENMKRKEWLHIEAAKEVQA